MYYYDIYGWLSDAPIEGRETEVEPMAVEGDMHPNWTGYEWRLQKYPPPEFWEELYKQQGIVLEG